MIRDDAMRSSASSAGAELLKVPKGAVIEEIGKSGGWRQVSYGGKKGWVRILSAKALDAGSGGSAAPGFTGGYDAKRVVAVAGLRGLSEEQLKAAKFSEPEMSRLESLGVSAGEARSFAREGGLVAARLERLPDPAALERERQAAERAAKEPAAGGGWGEETPLWGN